MIASLLTTQNHVCENTLLNDAEFLALLDEMEQEEPVSAPPRLGEIAPADNAKELPGVYTGKATTYAGNYDVPFLEFCQAHLPDALNYWVTNIDSFVIRARSGAIMMLELKRNNYDVKEHQRRTIGVVGYLIERGMKSCKGKVQLIEGSRKKKMSVQWYGYNVLKLSHDSFENSTFLWNDKPISRQMLISVLAMETRF